MIMKSTPLHVQKSDHIIKLSLNRPEQNNALNLELCSALCEQIDAVATNPAIRLLIISAQGNCFSAGADLKWMQASVNHSTPQLDNIVLRLPTLLNKLYRLNKPTIAIVQGSAYGGALGLLACCDFVIAQSDSHFRFSELRLGLIPALISPYIIKAIGNQNSRFYFLSAEIITAEQAMQLGLVYKVCQNAEVNSVLKQLCQSLLKNSPDAISACKHMLNELSPACITQEVIELSMQHFLEATQSKQARHGIEAFFAKQQPEWCVEYDNQFSESLQSDS